MLRTHRLWSLLVAMGCALLWAGCGGANQVTVAPENDVPLGTTLEASTETVLEMDTPRMDVARLDKVLRREVGVVNSTAGSGVWEFAYNGVRMACLTDTKHDRMRLVAPIAPVSELTLDQVVLMMEANFHTALDARYATNKGVLYATFIHPLSPLTETQLISAINQVASLTRTFGTSYSSGKLDFGAPKGNSL